MGIYNELPKTPRGEPKTNAALIYYVESLLARKLIKEEVEILLTLAEGGCCVQTK